LKSNEFSFHFTFSLKETFIGGGRSKSAREILGAAGALRDRLESDCSKNGVKMAFDDDLLGYKRSTKSEFFLEALVFFARRRRRIFFWKKVKSVFRVSRRISFHFTILGAIS